MVIVVVVLILFIIYEPGIKKPEHTLLTDELGIGQVNKITLQRNGKEIVKLEKQQLGWHIIEPFQLAANDIQVYGLLSILKENSFSQIISKDEELDKFGLKNPAVRLSLNNKEISVGTTDPINFRRYVLIDGTIHLINDAIYRYLSMEATRFISYALLPANKDIIEIDLPHTKLSKDNEDTHWTVSPDSTLSADDINMLLDSWRHARAIEINSWSTANSTDNETNDLINVRFADQTGLIFTIISTETDLILGRKDAGIKYRLPGKLKGILLNAQPPEKPADNIESPINLSTQ
jgi:hypothetical protein